MGFEGGLGCKAALELFMLGLALRLLAWFRGCSKISTVVCDLQHPKKLLRCWTALLYNRWLQNRPFISSICVLFGLPQQDATDWMTSTTSIIFLTVLEAASPRWRCQGWFLVRCLFLAGSWWPLDVSAQGLPPARVWSGGGLSVASSFSYKDTSPVRLGSTLMISLSRNYLL